MTKYYEPELEFGGETFLLQHVEHDKTKARNHANWYRRHGCKAKIITALHPDGSPMKLVYVLFGPKTK